MDSTLVQAGRKFPLGSRVSYLGGPPMTVVTPPTDRAYGAAYRGEAFSVYIRCAQDNGHRDGYPPHRLTLVSEPPLPSTHKPKAQIPAGDIKPGDILEREGYCLNPGRWTVSHVEPHRRGHRPAVRLYCDGMRYPFDYLASTTPWVSVLNDSMIDNGGFVPCPRGCGRCVDLCRCEGLRDEQIAGLNHEVEMLRSQRDTLDAALTREVRARAQAERKAREAEARERALRTRIKAALG